MSLVLELQRAAMEANQAATDVLRKSMVVSAKLRLPEFQAWCELELNGYRGGAEVPDYRVVRGVIKAYNPYNGWIPVIMEHAEAQEALSKRSVNQSIGELEFLIQSKEKGTLQIPFPQDILQRAFGGSECYELGMIPTLLIGKSQVVNIVQAVRNKILDWSLALEAKGVLGEAFTFSAEEVKRASTVTYNIGQFSGVLGNVSDSNIQVGNYNSIHPELKRLGVSQGERNELEEIMDQLPKSSGESRVALVKRGSAWVVRNGDKIGALSEALKSWFTL